MTVDEFCKANTYLTGKLVCDTKSNIDGYPYRVHIQGTAGLVSLPFYFTENDVLELAAQFTTWANDIRARVSKT